LIFLYYTLIVWSFGVVIVLKHKIILENVEISVGVAQLYRLIPLRTLIHIDQLAL
jgi:hypothetical protein